MVGTICLCIFFLLYHEARSRLAYDFLDGLSVGFSGCLSTISTFVYELNILSLGFAYLYGLVSTILAQIICIVIIGSATWAGYI